MAIWYVRSPGFIMLLKKMTLLLLLSFYAVLPWIIAMFLNFFYLFCQVRQKENWAEIKNKKIPNIEQFIYHH